jgi:RNA polymerase sigma-70 factor (ECF subfamily)
MEELEEQRISVGHDTVEDLSRLWGDLRVAVQRRGLDFHTSEDVVQESLLRTLQRRPLPEPNLRGWLSVVATRLAGRHRTEQRNRLAREQAVARSESIEPDGEEDSFLLRCVHEMSEPYGPVIQLRYLEEREVEEIAARLDRPQATVRSQIQRGLRQLRTRLSERDPRRAYALGLAGPWCRRGPWSWIRSRPWGRSGIVAAAGVLLLTGSAALLSLESPIRSVSRVSALPGPASAPAAKLAETSRSARSPGGGAVATAVPRPGAVLAGTVRAPGGEPVPGAEVFAGRWDGSAARRVAVTDGAGRFALSGVGPDDFIWGSAERWCDSARRYVATIAGSSDRDLVLTGSGERLTMLVRTHGGEPVVGARVELACASRLRTRTWLSAEGTLEVASAVTGRTDGAGIVELPRPVEDVVRVTVAADDHPAWVEETSLSEDSDRLEVALYAPATIAGRVLDEGGQPAWKASVEVLQPSQPIRCSWTGPDGSFEIARLGPGSFALRAAEDPSLGSASCFQEGALEAGGVARLELQLSAEHTIRGRVGDPAALAGGVARLLTTQGQRATWVERTAVIGPDGEFDFPGCPERAARALDVFAPGSSVPWGWLREVQCGSDNLVLAQELEPLVVEFDCAEPRLVPALVELRQAFPPFSVMARVDPESARATFLALPRLEYLAVALVPGLGTWSAGVVDGSGPSRLRRIRVPEPGSVSGELRMPPGARMQSVSAWVDVPSFSPDVFAWGKNFNLELAVDQAGGFGLELFPGDHDLIFECSGVESVMRRVHVEEGLDQHVTIEPVAGRPVQLRLLLPRHLKGHERLRLEALVPTGRAQVVILAKTIVSDGASPGVDVHARASIPANATEIQALTNLGLAGSALLDPARASDQTTEVEIEVRESGH